MATIKIAVACHKPSELPNNPIYCPVQVGSALAKKRMEGMLHDDEGDNISEKNPSYCELTAQYWAWKNLDADYLGLCHYRRFLTFAEGDFKRNERNQICAGFIDDYNKKRFGLEDEERMHEVIEQYDCVVGELESIPKINTPHGKQKTVYLHWAKHDRDLINVHDLDRMIEIVDERYPQYSKEMHAYLNGKVFLGYNVFVMKRALFDEMCSFEFDVLSRLERDVDMSHYSQMRTRIYGFMAEILYSVYVYHLENAGYRVKHLPLVYFNVTDPLPSYILKPIEGAIPVVFNVVEQPFDQALVDITVRSFLRTCGTTTRYDVIVAHQKMSAMIKSDLDGIVANMPNVSIRYMDADAIDEGLFDRIGYVEKSDELGHYKKTVDIEALLPWILPEYDRVLSVEWNVLFNASVEGLWRSSRESGSSISASPNLSFLAHANKTLDVSYKRARSTLGMKDPYSFFSTSTAVLNLKEMRSEQNLDRIIALYKSQHFDIRVDEVLNAVYEGSVSYWDFDAVYPVVDEWQRANILPAAPLSSFRAYQSVQSPCIIAYDRALFFVAEPNPAMSEFWSVARTSPFYEALLSYLSDLRFITYLECHRPLRRFLDQTMPSGSDARQALASKAGSLLSVLYPDGSKRRARIEKSWPQSWIKSRLLRYMS